MYAKTLDNFRFVPSTKASTARKQRERFNRSPRRVFGSIIPKNNGEFNYKELISIGRKYGFLFLESQYVNKRISHLKHTRTRVTPIADQFQFSIPHASETVPAVADVKADEIIETLAGPVLTALPYNPIPDMFIPHKYRNIIPKDPIYDEKGSFIVPGSREWFTFMYKLEIQTAIKVAEERRLRLIQEEQIAREEHKARVQKLARDEAAYYGTTPHYLDKRRKLTDDSTTLNKIYHDSMSRYRKRLLYNQDSLTKEHRKLKAEMKEFFLRFPQDTGILPAHRYAHKDRTTDENSASTSEDTKDLECRPLKCDVIKTSNISLHHDLVVRKRARHDSISDVNTTVAGSSY
ncbi:unnamed protein product [Rhizophagus irregularis]|nr:unnamed protein product [Rhizophagus irregularis]